MDAILRLDEQGLKYFVESGQSIPADAIEDVFMAFGPINEDILWEEGTGVCFLGTKVLCYSRKTKKMQALQVLCPGG